MKIVLATLGSRGDVQPMLALALGLRTAGHDVRLAGPPEKAGWAAELGCSYYPLGSDVTAFIDGVGSAHTFKAALVFNRFLRREIEKQFETLPEIVRGADILIGASLSLGLSSVAEALKVPYRYIVFTPQMLPSRHHPCIAFRHQGRPGWLNLLGWQLVKQADRLNLTRCLNRHRRRFGLMPVRDLWTHILGTEPIVASDHSVAAVPRDAQVRAVQTGYMHLRQPKRTIPELEDFLASDPPPLFAGFGSMPQPDQARLMPLIVQAARRVGQRVIVGRFWRDTCSQASNGDVFFISRYPHDHLFPRVKAVLHHGGAGTTATAAISGVPQIIVPHALDQFFWGERIFRAKLGPKPVWRSRLTVRRLANAIQACLANVHLERQAAAVGRLIRQADGVRRTIRAIMNPN